MKYIHLFRNLIYVISNKQFSNHGLSAISENVFDEKNDFLKLSEKTELL